MGGGEFCINNDELCIQNDDLCIQNDEFIFKNQGSAPSDLAPTVEAALLEAGADPFAGEMYFGGVVGSGGSMEMGKMRVD